MTGRGRRRYYRSGPIWWGGGGRLRRVRRRLRRRWRWRGFGGFLRRRRHVGRRRRLGIMVTAMTWWRAPVRRLLSKQDESAVIARHPGGGSADLRRDPRARRDGDAPEARWPAASAGSVGWAWTATRERNGILFYVAVDDRAFAIVGGAGIHAKVGDAVLGGAARRDDATRSRKGSPPPGSRARSRRRARASRSTSPSGRRPERAPGRDLLLMDWKRARARSLWIVGGGAVVGVVGLASFCVALRSDRRSNLVEVPDWIGRAREEAVAQAQTLGPRDRSGRACGTTRASRSTGSCSRSRRRERRCATAGRSASSSVSGGETLTVPSVTGQPTRQAELELRRQGLTPGWEARVHDSRRSRRAGDRPGPGRRHAVRLRRARASARLRRASGAALGDARSRGAHVARRAGMDHPVRVPERRRAARARRMGGGPGRSSGSCPCPVTRSHGATSSS